MTPLDVVLSHFKFPDYIDPHPLQVGVINDLAPLSNSGEWLQMGTGKTFCSTACMLYLKIVMGIPATVIMPPTLIRQWFRWLQSIKTVRPDAPALKILMYRGTPKQRAVMDIAGADFVLVGIQIFKKDYARFVDAYRDRMSCVTIDEAAPMVSNIDSDQHQKVYDFAIGRPQTVLSGTPTNNPADVYGIMKFSAPGTYKNHRQFENLHVEDRDFFGKAVEFRDLGEMGSKLMVNSRRILYHEMYSETQKPLYVPIEYDLDPAHYKLYRTLAEQEILKLPDGGKIEATSVNKLMHALGQIVLNWGHFCGDPSKVSESINLIDEKLDELGDGKLLVFANYKMSIAALKLHLEHRGVVTYNSEVNERQKERNLDQFMGDPKCRVMAAQFISGGKGLDGLQHVCNHVLFIEPCQQPRDFHQAVARLDRLGQRKRVMAMMATASNTVQLRGFRNLLKNDSIVNQVIRNTSDLRAAIYGEATT